MDDAVMALLHCRDPSVDVTVLVDGNLAPPFPRLRQFLANPPAITPIIKGDGRHGIAAASIMAKETRDLLMDDLDQNFWLWLGRKQRLWHQSPSIGPSETGGDPHHRRSFKPIEQLL